VCIIPQGMNFSGACLCIHLLSNSTRSPWMEVMPVMVLEAVKKFKKSEFEWSRNKSTLREMELLMDGKTRTLALEQSE